MLKVSIVTINFNNSKGLKKTIESVVGQTYKNLEYIVIDGNSSDDSVEVIKQYADKISYWVSEKDKGVFDAQNKGLAKATGDYILVLNSGDELENTSVLETIFSTDHLEDIIYGNMIIAYTDGKRETGYMPQTISFEHMMRDTLWHPVSFVRKDFLSKTGLYDTSYKIVADYDWFLKAIFTYRATLKYLNKTISVFYLDGLSSAPENAEKIRLERLRSQIAVFGESKVNTYYASVKKTKPSLFTRIINKLIS